MIPNFYLNKDEARLIMSEIPQEADCITMVELGHMTKKEMRMISKLYQKCDKLFKEQTQ